MSVHNPEGKLVKIGNMARGSRLYVSDNAIVRSADQEKTSGYFINGFTDGKLNPTDEDTIPVEKLSNGRLVATVPAGFSPRSMWITSRENRPNLSIDLQWEDD